MSDSQEDNQTIKIVDKRRFSESGDSISKENPVNVNEASRVFTAASEDIDASAVNKTAPNDKGLEGTNVAPEKIDFPSFLVGFYYQTLSFLGEIPNPENNTVTKNIEAARQHIDILNLLEEKTKGNLTQEEEKLFTEILNNLRLLFVKSSKGN